MELLFVMSSNLKNNFLKYILTMRMLRQLDDQDHIAKTMKIAHFPKSFYVNLANRGSIYFFILAETC